MKKLIAVILIMAMLLPAVALADYTPDLGMTIDEFILKYNSVQASLNSPYVSLDRPYQQNTWNGFRIAHFYADKDKKVTILLMTKDPGSSRITEAGLDEIQIFIPSDKDMVPLIGVTNRCAGLVSANIFGTSLSTMRTADTICYYYENNCKERGLTSYSGLDEEGKFALVFFFDTYYYFQISTVEAVK